MAVLVIAAPVLLILGSCMVLAHLTWNETVTASGKDMRPGQRW